MKNATFYITTIFIYLILTQPVLAQQQTLRIGPPTKEEIELTICPFDSSASAVVLQDFGLFFPQFIEDDGSLKNISERHVRIKIITNEGVSAATVAISYYDADQIIYPPSRLRQRRIFGSKKLDGYGHIETKGTDYLKKD